MLFDRDQRVWCRGATPAHVATHEWRPGRPPLTLAIDCLIAGESVTAFIDTGAPWSVLGGELVSRFDHLLGPPGEVQALKTAHMDLEGPLCRLPVTVLGEEGTSMDLRFNVIVSELWSGPPLFFGMKGCLDSFRWALDAGAKPEDTPTFYFGEFDWT